MPPPPGGNSTRRPARMPSMRFALALLAATLLAAPARAQLFKVRALTKVYGTGSAAML